MSRLFVKRLYLTPLLAAKQSPRCRFPTRSFNSSATLYNSTAPSAVHNNEASGNANPGRQWTPWDEDDFIDRAFKLGDHAHSSDDRFTTLVKDDAIKASGDMRSKMEATIAKLHVEFRTNMAKNLNHEELESEMGKFNVELSTEMGKFNVELSTEMGKFSAGMRKFYAELKAEMAKTHEET